MLFLFAACMQISTSMEGSWIQQDDEHVSWKTCCVYNGVEVIGNGFSSTMTQKHVNQGIAIYSYYITNTTVSAYQLLEKREWVICTDIFV